MNERNGEVETGSRSDIENILNRKKGRLQIYKHFKARPDDGRSYSG